MEQHIKIQDNSGDKKYFSMIPHYIVNHSTAYEQSLYLIMKRIAGENGSCFASLNTLSKMMGVHKTTVTKTMTKLLRRKWIEETLKIKVKGGYVRQFKIIDLWREAIDFYDDNKGGAEMTTKGGALIDGSGALVDGSGAESDTKNINKNINKKTSFFKKKKPFFRGEEMRKSKGKWWVLPSDGGDWLEFAGEEGDIKY